MGQGFPPLWERNDGTKKGPIQERAKNIIINYYYYG